MKVLILAGGFGSRLSEYTDIIPKPMVQIGGMPIIWHIMKRYAKFGFNDFLIALGYKSQVIKEFFLNYSQVNSDFKINLKSREVNLLNNRKVDWNVTLIDTGQKSMTGGRIKRLQKFIHDKPFMLTYGDGVADIDIQKLYEFHKDKKKIATVTAVHPAARFGQLNIEGNFVKSFIEKPQLDSGCINGGFFVFQPEIFNYLKDDLTILERDPLENIAKIGELSAFKHEGFWQCMDTKRDKDRLEELWKSGKAPWTA